MGYDPQNMTGRPPIHDGVYNFTIIDAKDRVYSTGTEGCSIVMDVFLADDRIIKVYESLFYTKKALWKMKSLCEAVGLEFEARPKPEAFIRKSGKGFFTRKPNSKFLEVKEFFPEKSLTHDIPRKGPPPQRKQRQEAPPPEPPPMTRDERFPF